MDDIKGPNTQKPNPAAPEGSAPTGTHEQPTTPEMHPASPAPAPEADEKKKGMKGWVVALLVVLALVIGGAGVYFWQTSQNTNDETEQLQAQIDATNAELAAAKEAAAESSDEAKDEEIADLTKANETLTTENATLQKQVDDLVKTCTDNPELNDDCTPKST